MSEQNTTPKLKDPRNPYDPIVVFDPELPETKVVVGYYPENEADKATSSRNPQEGAETRQTGIRFPLIKVNNNVINKGKIKAFKLSIMNFLPEIHLEISDADGLIQATDVPGFNNVITVILIAPVDGANKKITLNFYIKSCKFDNGTGIYDGEYKLIDLQKTRCKQVGTDAISTYDCLSEIAKDCKLGFAATEGCKDIEDKRWRQIYSQTYVDFIKQQISFGGLDENSVFQAWIDEFNYLVMVNISKILYEKCEPEQLSIKIIKGETPTSNNDSNIQQSVEEVQRIINNGKFSGINNMHFDKQQAIVSTDAIKDYGTLNTLYYMKGAAETNSIVTKQIQIIEDSVDGIEGLDEYQYEKSKFVGVDMSEDSNILYQTAVVKTNRLKYFSEKLMVEMPKANYSLQRGMLVGVTNYEYNMNNKNVIMDNSSNANALQGEMTDRTVEGFDKSETMGILQNDSYPVMNPALSGIYYIDGIEFVWNMKDVDIKQRLYLVKKGIRSRLINKYTTPKNKSANE